MNSKVIGRYEIVRELGKGGMGTVFLARDLRLPRDVALKILNPSYVNDPKVRERFVREAKTIAGLEHHAIVPVYDFGEHQGQLYLVMRLIPGGTLVDRLAKGTLSLEQTEAILSRISSALDRAHEKGIIHRDLKPANILFDEDGKAYLSDFGIVKVADATMLTGTHVLIGTPHYVSPEQARGDGDLDSRSDIYSLGAVVFEMLSGRPPYDTDTALGVAMKHLTAPVPRLQNVRPDLPSDLDAVLSQAMAKERELRFATAGQLTRAFSNAAHSASVAPDAPTVMDGAAGTEKLREPSPPKSIFSLRLVLPALALLVILALLLFLGDMPLFGSAQSPTIATATSTVSAVADVMDTSPAATETALPRSSPTSPATVTSTPTVQATATATPAPSPTFTAVPVPGPRFFDVYFCLEECLANGLNAQQRFAGGITLIHVRWRFEHVPNGVHYERIWRSNGEIWAHYDCTWEGEEQGIDAITLTEPDGLRSGEWEMLIRINSRVVMQEEITLSGDHDYWAPVGRIDSCYGKV